LDGALPFAEQPREGALAPEPADDALGRVGLFPVHACRVTEISLGRYPCLEAKPPESEWITLITCGDRFQATEESGLGYYLERDVVIAAGIR
jgi:hypothetical protein